MDTAYFWYREHPYFGEFYPGKVLNLITDENIFLKYVVPSQLGLIRKFFPDGLTPHGMQTLINRNMCSQDVDGTIAEIIFELVRQIHFPNAPSRLTSLFASQTIDAAEQWDRFWYKCFGPIVEQLPKSLWEIEFETDAKLFDASFFDVMSNNKFSYLLGLENAYRYWRGEFSDEPLPELLIPYPVTVLRSVREANSAATTR